jgi:transposase
VATHKPSKSKINALRERGCLHPRPEVVSDELFVTADFFDPNDLLQVKYEMVRRVCTEGLPVSHAARSFGVARPTVYQALCAFEQGGLAGLQPKRPGPRRAHKMSEEVVDFLEGALVDAPDTGTGELVVAVQKRFGLSVHPRSVERALARRKKKRR